MPLRHSLRLRLLLVMVLVALLPVGTAAYLVHRATERAFYDYSSERSLADAQMVAMQIDANTGTSAFVVKPGEILVSGVDAPAENAAGGAGISSTEPATIVTSAWTGDTMAAPNAGVEAGGSIGGSVAFEPGEPPPGDAAYTISLPGLPDQRFLGEMTRALLIAVALAAAVALVLAGLLARQILRPVQTLTDAARGMTAGDLQRRVRVRSRDEIGALAVAFNAMADGRERLDALRRNLVNDVAHELRSPLANLQGYLEVLRDGLTPPTPEAIATLHEESLLLSRLVADLQELALAEAGELPLTTEPVDLCAEAARAIDAIRPQAEAKGVVLRAADPADSAPVLVDPARLGQILRNLLRNALTHTPAGGAIELRTWSDGDHLALAVCDTGYGISPEHLPFVFDRFYRADPARARTTGGSGLGLAIVKHLAEAQRGRVEVSSEPGAGSTFTVYLPRAADASAAPMSSSPILNIA